MAHASGDVGCRLGRGAPWRPPIAGKVRKSAAEDRWIARARTAAVSAPPVPQATSRKSHAEPWALDPDSRRTGVTPTPSWPPIHACRSANCSPSSTRIFNGSIMHCLPHRNGPRRRRHASANWWTRTDPAQVGFILRRRPTRSESAARPRATRLFGEAKSQSWRSCTAGPDGRSPVATPGT